MFKNDNLWKYINFTKSNETNWILIYFMIALDCDSPILESFFFNYPRFVNFGQDPRKQEEGMHYLYIRLRKMLISMHHEYEGKSSIVMKECDKINSLQLNFVADCGSCLIFGWKKSTNTISLTVKIEWDNQREYYFQLSIDNIFIDDACLIMRMGHIGGKFHRESKLRIHDYQNEIHYFLSQFISLTPNFWQLIGKLPNKLEI